ncbi:MAG: IS200/IS605 family transposase [Saprospiraceae bacterium]
MANTYHQIYVQAVFAVKYRAAVIENHWKPKLLAVIGNLILETGCKSMIVNGVEDHIHCFFGLKPSISVSNVMKNAKAKSSKWLNESCYLRNRFEWQEGYGAFSYSHSDINNVYSYIQNQEVHHKTQSFRDEYLGLLKRYEVEYDDQYLFEDLI